MKNTKKHIALNWRKTKLRDSIINQTKKDKNIIYGQRSINAQVPNMITRKTDDYDILSKNPKRAAIKTRKNLNKIVGYNQFYSKPALHPGTYKVMHVGNDMKPNTRDDVGWVDYTKMPRPRPKVRIINGVRYRVLSEEAKAKRKSLSEKEMAFRHKKDKGDLSSIKLYKRLFR